MEQNGIEGFVFFVEVSILYIIDSIGNICLINGEEEKIQEFREHECYNIKNLFFIRQENNYFIYDMNKNTTYNLLKEKAFFKHFAIIKFIALDQLNAEKDIKIKVISNSDEKIYQIKRNIQFVSVLRNDDSTYFLQNFELSINNKKNIYSFFIYKRYINSINYSLEENNLNKNKSYELIYLTKEINNLPSYANVSNYIVRAYDKFYCSHRIRFNIMNVKPDKNIYYFNTDLSSLEVIYLIDKNNKIVKYGIFDINSHKEKILTDYVFDPDIKLHLNNFYDEYKDKITKTQKATRTYYNLKCEIIKKKNLYTQFKYIKHTQLNNFNKTSLNNENAWNFFKNYYFFLFLDFIKSKDNWPKFLSYSYLLNDLELGSYDYYTKIRIITDFIHNIFYYNQIPRFLNIKKLEKDNPYRLAIKFQRQIINKIKETSNIFYPILQFNSKILKILPDSLWDIFKNKIKSLFYKNIKKDEYAYTISLENLGDMKTHLLSLQEDFFFIFVDDNTKDLLGKYSHATKITTINQYLLCDDIYLYDDLKRQKDYAFSINLVFSHERMGHAKEDLNNPANESPYIFFNKDFQKDFIFKEKTKYYVGESGRMFESFISNRCLIKFMKEEKKFGEFLDIKYFIKDFSEINAKAILEFKKTNLYLKAQNKMKFYLSFEILLFLVISIYFLIRLIGMEMTLTNLLIVLTLLLSLYFFIGFIKKNYDKYSEPYKYDELFNDTDIINDNKGKEKRLIYPDDYPFESETFMGRYFPFLQFKEKKIRRRFDKYSELSMKKFYDI